MSDIYYLNTNNKRVDFIDDFPLEDIDSLFASIYNNIINKNIISGFEQGIFDYTIKGELSTKKINDIADIFYYDIKNNVRGRFYIGEYYMLCNVTGFSPESVNLTRSALDTTLTITTDSPRWIKESHFNFYKFTYDEGTKEGFDYPYDYLYDYYADNKSGGISNVNIDECEFKMEIFGPVVNPVIRIGGHLYNVNADLGKSERLVIESLDKKIYKVKNNGERINQFYLRNRDSDVFKKFEQGYMSVYWDGTFGFDITLYEERGEPRWLPL